MVDLYLMKGRAEGGKSWFSALTRFCHTKRHKICKSARLVRYDEV